MKVMVTGGAGFIGTNLIERLIKQKIGMQNSKPKNVLKVRT